MESARPYLSSKHLIYGSFVLGLLTAIAFRAIIILEHVEPSWVRPMWYFAVLGNFLFFFYRFRISKKRKDAIENFQLMEKVQRDASLGSEEKDVLLYLLSSIRVSLEARNYAIIFFMSLVAIAADMVLTSLR